MTNVILTVPDISCGHCEQTVKKALTGVAGIQQVSVNIPTKQVSVAYDPAAVTIDQMKSVLAEEDYPVASVTEGAGAGDGQAAEQGGSNVTLFG